LGAFLSPELSDQYGPVALRMGLSERDSVLRPTGEARGVARLLVADNAALPNAIGNPNPTRCDQVLTTPNSWV
jgi:hypothetical protein